MEAIIKEVCGENTCHRMESVCFQLWDIKPKVMNRFLIENIDIKEKNDGTDPYKPYSKINNLVVSFPWLFDKQIYQEGNNEEEKEEITSSITISRKSKENRREIIEEVILLANTIGKKKGADENKIREDITV